MQGSEKHGLASMRLCACPAAQLAFNKHSDLSGGNDCPETGDQAMKANFSVAEKFHANYYHGFMDDFQIVDDRPLVEEFVVQLLALAV